jgi:Carbohydrate/starch-binding module (family 21)
LRLGTINEQVLQFALRYDVGGQTFFDNNSGQDYRFMTNLAIVGGNVILNKAVSKQGAQAGGGFVFTTSWLEGEILVNNLSFVKNVGIRLSVDGGISWNDTVGFFAGSHDSDNIFIGPGAEVWRFKTPELNLVSNPSEFRFAVFYQNGATGESFWDNNFGQDYKISKAAESTIR